MTKEPTVTLGDKTYKVMPMNFKTLIKISPLLKSLEKVTASALPDQEDFENIVNIIVYALERANPDINFDIVADNLDMKNIMGVLADIMKASGATNMGEAKAVSQ